MTPLEAFDPLGMLPSSPRLEAALAICAGLGSLLFGILAFLIFTWLLVQILLIVKTHKKAQQELAAEHKAQPARLTGGSGSTGPRRRWRWRRT